MTVDLDTAVSTLDCVLGKDLRHDDPDTALADLLMVAAAITGAVPDRQLTPAFTPAWGALPDKLKEAIRKFREAAQHIGEALNASEVSIGVSVPLGVTVGLTFPVNKTGDSC